MGVLLYDLVAGINAASPFQLRLISMGVLLYDRALRRPGGNSGPLHGVCLGAGL
jgi:hypothetical protein